MRIIAGRHKGRNIIAPHGQSTRPTASRAREALFSLLETGTPGLAGCRFLDLYAGSGAIGLEACSRGAATVLLIDKSAQALNAAKRNIEQFDEADIVTVRRMDATRLPPGTEKFDVIYMDPPYRLGLIAGTLNSLEKSGWLEPHTVIVAEMSTKEPVPAHPRFHTTDQRTYGLTRLVFFSRENLGN